MQKSVLSILIIYLSVMLSYNTLTSDKDSISKINSSASEVLELNELNFDEFNRTNTHYYIEFYVPSCLNCQILEPIYQEAALESISKGIPCLYTKVDVTVNFNLARIFNVEDYPTIFWVDNVEGNIYGFDGERDVKSFIKFSNKKLNLFKIEELSSFDELEKYNHTNISTASNILLIVLNGVSRSEYHKEILNLFSAAEENNFEKVFITSSQNIIEKLNVRKNEKFSVFTIIYDRASQMLSEPEKLEIEIKSELETLESTQSLLSHYKYKLYGEIDNDEMNNLIDKGEPTLILFHDDNFSKSDNAKLVNNFMNNLALKYRKNLHIFNSSINSKATALIVEVLRFKNEELPLLLLTQLNHNKLQNTESDELDKFKIDNVVLTKENIEKFIIDWKENRLSPFLASEDIPLNPYDENGIHKVVGKTFNNFITTQGKDLVLAICSNLAKRCVKFQQRLINVANKFKNNTNLIIATTDPNFNEYSVTIEPKFPVIFFFPTDTDNLTTPDRFVNRFLYDGDYTTKSITEFILQNSHHSITLNNLLEEDKIELTESNDPIESKLEGDESEFDNIQELLKGELGDRLKGNNEDEFNIASFIPEYKDKENSDNEENVANNSEEEEEEEGEEEEEKEEEEEEEEEENKDEQEENIDEQEENKNDQEENKDEQEENKNEQEKSDKEYEDEMEKEFRKEILEENIKAEIGTPSMAYNPDL